MFAHDFTGAILRAIIDHDDFKVVIVRIQQAANGGLDDALFIKGGYDDRNERLVLFAGVPSVAASRTHPLRKRQRADHPQSCQSQHDADDEGPLQKPAAGRKEQKSQSVRARVNALTRWQQRYYLIAAPTAESRNRYELESARAQFMNYARQGFDGCLSVAA